MEASGFATGTSTRAGGPIASALCDGPDILYVCNATNHVAYL